MNGEEVDRAVRRVESRRRDSNMRCRRWPADRHATADQKYAEDCLALAALHNPNLQSLVKAISLAARHAKVRRHGYARDPFRAALRNQPD